MTPLEAAALLQQWAAKAKTSESREACEMAVEAMHNSAKTHKLAELTNDSVVIHHMHTTGYFEVKRCEPKVPKTT